MALYDFFDGPPAPLNSQLMDKVNHYNWTKQIDFSMGPSVKFVFAIIDSISNQKKGFFFLWQSRTRRGGGGVVLPNTIFFYILSTKPKKANICCAHYFGFSQVWSQLWLFYPEYVKPMSASICAFAKSAWYEWWWAKKSWLASEALNPSTCIAIADCPAMSMGDQLNLQYSWPTPFLHQLVIQWHRLLFFSALIFFLLV